MTDLLKLKKDLVDYSRRCYDRNLISATGGNISIRVPGTGTMLIKSSGSAFSDMTEEDVVLADFDGNVLEGDKKLSKEWRFHSGIYKVREEVGAVVHIHPPYATAVANTMDHLPLITNHAKVYLKNVPTIGMAASGSEELGEKAVEPFEGSDTVAVLMEEHGIITVGPEIRKAFFLAEMLEDTAKIYLMSRLNIGVKNNG
jgi:L-fuculose-phosphate aldolase